MLDQERLRAAAEPDGSSRSTLEGVDFDPATGRRAVWARRAFIALLAVIVAVGLLDLLGVRSRTVRAQSADGTETVEVYYAQVARAGLDVPFRITVHRDGGFNGQVVLAVSSDYLDLFDRSDVDPTPASATATEDSSVWRFEAPPGDTLQVAFDMQVQGGRHWGRKGTVAVLDDNGSPIVQVGFKTWLSP